MKIAGTGLVQTEGLDTIVPAEEASDFYEVFGLNTDYTIDPEEAMADNFSYAIVCGADGVEYNSPEIIEGVLAALAAA